VFWVTLVLTFGVGRSAVRPGTSLGEALAA